MPKKIVLAVGGSGGHLFPATVLARQIQGEVLFMGAGLKHSFFFRQSEFSYRDIPSASFRKKNPIAFIRSMSHLFLGTCKSLFHLRREKVDLVIGFGSFHSFPILLAATLLRIPRLLFEANCSLGKVNTFFSYFSKVVSQFPIPDAVQVQRLPWNNPKKLSSQEAKKKLGLQPDIFTIFIFGGSQGAVFINGLAIQVLQKLDTTLQVIHLTGSERAAEEVKKVYDALSLTSYVKPFKKEMFILYAACDLVFSRSGASTISELIYFEKGAILIPYPYAGGHQEANARFLEKIGGAIVFVQKEVTIDDLTSKLREISSKTLAANIRAFKEQEKALPHLLDLIYE